MNLSDYVQMLYSIIGNGTKVFEFMILLTDNIMQNPVTDEDKQKEANEEYNPFTKISINMCEKIFNNNRNLSKKNARIILTHLDKDKFEKFLSSFSNNAIDLIGNAIQQKGIEISDNNVHSACADLFVSILQNCSKGVGDPEGKKTTNNELKAKMKKMEQEDLISDLENIRKIRPVMNNLLDLLSRYSCTAVFSLDILDDIDELHSAFSCTRFYNQIVLDAVAEFFLKYSNFMEYLIKYTCESATPNWGTGRRCDGHSL